jgi:hypothetical protein
LRNYTDVDAAHRSTGLS